MENTFWYICLFTRVLHRMQECDFGGQSAINELLQSSSESRHTLPLLGGLTVEWTGSNDRQEMLILCEVAVETLTASGLPSNMFLSSDYGITFINAPMQDYITDALFSEMSFTSGPNDGQFMVRFCDVLELVWLYAIAMSMVLTYCFRLGICTPQPDRNHRRITPLGFCGHWFQLCQVGSVLGTSSCNNYAAARDEQLCLLCVLQSPSSMYT